MKTAVRKISTTEDTEVTEVKTRTGSILRVLRVLCGGAFVLAAVPAFAQEAPRAPTQPLAIPPPATAKPAPPPPGPTPRRPDGSVILGSLPSDNGIWVGDGRLAVNPKSYEPKSNVNAPIHIDAIPLQEWARALVDARHGESLRTEPHPRCKPSGGPRQFITPYGFEILELPEIKRVYVWDIGGPHSFRVIYTDGRPHPKDLEPSYYGHSVGRWEGDTLVVDAVGFSEKFWFSRDGLPHTDQLHLTERITRTNMNTLRYEVTVDDPGAYTSPWTSSFNVRWTPGTEVWEFMCQGNNFFPEAVFYGPGQMDPGRIVTP